MLTILVCLIQISMIAIIAGSMATWFMARAPQLSARLCSLAIVLSAVVVLLTLFGTPRLWNLRNVTAHVPTTKPVASATTQTASQVSDAAGRDAHGITITAQHVLNQLAELQSQHRTADAGLATAFAVFASVLGIVFMARSIYGVWWLKRLRGARDLDENSIAMTELRALQAAASFQGTLRLCESTDIASPCISWFRPGTIYVPIDFEHWSSEERLATLAHELSHQIRRDPQQRLFADACLTLVYFHPLMLLVRKQLVFAQELATDRHAAQLLGNLTRYRRGLSLLALRMDSQCNQFSLVSVSNNEVIRRIKMLKSTKPNLRRWQEVVSIGTATLMLVLCAAWTARADDTLRIAALKKNAAKTQDNLPLDNPAPWERLGAQAGYFQASPQQLSQHPTLRLLCDAYTQQILSVAPKADLAAIGLDPKNTKLVQAAAVVTLAKIPEEKRAPSGEKHNLSLGSDAISIDTIGPANWNAVVDLIPAGMLPPEALAWVKSELATFDGGTHMQLVSTAAADRSEEHMPQLRALWEQVEHGAIAVATTQIKSLAENLDPADDIVGVCKLLEMTDAAAVGIELAPGQVGQTVKLSFCPSEETSTDALVEQLQSVRDKLVAVAKAGLSAASVNEAEQPGLASIQSLLSQLETIKFEIAETREEVAVVRAEMTTDINLSKLLEMM